MKISIKQTLTLEFDEVDLEICGDKADAVAKGMAEAIMKTDEVTLINAAQRRLEKKIYQFGAEKDISDSDNIREIILGNIKYNKGEGS